MKQQHGFPNYYKVLGIPEYSSNAKVKQAHAELMHKFRKEQDEGLCGPAFEERRQLVEEAYQVLSNDKRRREFDQFILGNKQKIYTVEGTAIVQMPSDFTVNEIMYRDGLEHLANGRYDQAVMCFKKVLQYDKDNPFLLKLIAKSYENSGEAVFAQQAIERAIELEPDDWESQLTIGKIQEMQKRLLAARKSFRLAYQLNPKNREVITQFDRGSLVLEKISLGVKWGFRHFQPDSKAKSFQLSDGLITVDIMMNWKIEDKLRWFFAQFRPNPNARSFRLADGLITREMLARFIEITGEKFSPLPNSHTFRYRGFW